jgi:hypothetical protein
MDERVGFYEFIHAVFVLIGLLLFAVGWLLWQPIQLLVNRTLINGGGVESGATHRQEKQT